MSPVLGPVVESVFWKAAAHSGTAGWRRFFRLINLGAATRCTMMGVRLAIGAAWVLGLLLVGCAQDSAFLCREDVDCGEGGQCEPDANCSFEDPECPSGRRYGKFGDAVHQGTCVPVGGETSTAGPVTTTSSTVATGVTTSPSTTNAITTGPTGTSDESSSTGTVPVTGGSTESSGSTTFSITSSSSDSGSSDSGSTTAGGVLFADDFERPDSPTLGNGWWEQSTAFELIAGEVHNLGPGIDFESHLALRPDSTVPLDSEQTIEFTITSPDFGSGSPQLHARVQNEGDVPASRSYICFANGDAVCVSRHTGGNLENNTCDPTPIPFSTNRYRLTMLISGQATVVVDCLLEIFDENVMDFVEHAHQIVPDSADERINATGRVGFSAHNDPGTFVYDNYTLAGQ